MKLFLFQRAPETTEICGETEKEHERAYKSQKTEELKIQQPESACFEVYVVVVMSLSHQENRK